MILLKHLFIIISLTILCVDNGYSQEQKSSIRVKITELNSDIPTPVRVKITDSDNNAVMSLPNEVISIMYGRYDRFERFGFQPDSSFYVGGEFNIDLKEGKYQIKISKGMEYLDQINVIKLKKGEQRILNYELRRWVNMEKQGWYSADDHIHIRRSPRENPLLLKWIEAEGLNVGVMLQMGDIWTTYYSQYGFGEKGSYLDNLSLISAGQEEPRTSELGHTISLVADDFVRSWGNDYYLYNNNFDKIHELNGIVGYAHQGAMFYGFRGMTMDVLDNKVDFLEILQYCADEGPLITKNYYHFLDLGYKLTATAGSDFPWCGNGSRFGTEGSTWNARIGNVRFYTYIEEEFNYKSWRKSIVGGHTFVSSGPMLLFKVNNQLPGAEINLKHKQKVSICAEAFGNQHQVPLSKLEIVAHGKVIKVIYPNNLNQTLEHLTLNFDIEVETGIWIAARTYAGPSQVAHTTPIYISVDNKGFHNDATLQEYLELNEKYLNELEIEINKPFVSIYRNSWRYKKELMKRIEKTRTIIDSLKEK